jgi:hypothetical protein
LATFCDKWCKQENTEKTALSSWKKAILDIIDLRINFYNKNPSLLPRKSKYNLPFIKKGLKTLHSKYVLVPADKASNNIIFV